MFLYSFRAGWPGTSISSVESRNMSGLHISFPIKLPIMSFPCIFPIVSLFLLYLMTLSVLNILNVGGVKGGEQTSPVTKTIIYWWKFPSVDRVSEHPPNTRKPRSVDYSKSAVFCRSSHEKSRLLNQLLWCLKGAKFSGHIWLKNGG